MKLLYFFFILVCPDCFEEGTVEGSYCNKHDGQCECRTGWTGRRCQTPPPSKFQLEY